MENPVFDAIPHRPPFLFVDEIIEVTDDHIQTRLTLREDMEFFQGHYPGNPIFPGVLSCEAIMQSGAILSSHILKKQNKLEAQTYVPVVTRMNKVKFKAMLGPGDVVDMEVFLDTVVSDVFFMKGYILHNGKKIVQMEFASKLASLSELDLSREQSRV